MVVLKGDSIKKDVAKINIDEICFCFAEFIKSPTFRCSIAEKRRKINAEQCLYNPWRSHTVLLHYSHITSKASNKVLGHPPTILIVLVGQVLITSYFPKIPNARFSEE